MNPGTTRLMYKKYKVHSKRGLGGGGGGGGGGMGAANVLILV